MVHETPPVGLSYIDVCQYDKLREGASFAIEIPVYARTLAVKEDSLKCTKGPTFRIGPFANLLPNRRSSLVPFSQQAPFGRVTVTNSGQFEGNQMCDAIQPYSATTQSR